MPRGRRPGSHQQIKCGICLHPERGRIDFLVCSGAGVQPTAKKFGVSYDSLRNHVAKHIAQSYRDWCGERHSCPAALLKHRLLLGAARQSTRLGNEFPNGAFAPLVLVASDVSGRIACQTRRLIPVRARRIAGAPFHPAVVGRRRHRPHRPTTRPRKGAGSARYSRRTFVKTGSSGPLGTSKLDRAVRSAEPGARFHTASTLNRPRRRVLNVRFCEGFRTTAGRDSATGTGPSSESV